MTVALRIAALLLTFLLSVPASFAAPAVVVWPTVGTPTSKVIINGTGFNAYAAVDVYYDTAHLCLALASSTGSVTCTIKVPRDAQPEFHWVTMVQRNNGFGAQKPHLVRTDMAQFHGRNAAHTGVNPFENTLNVNNVGDLDTLWSRPIGPSNIYGSVVVAGGQVYAGGLNANLYAFNALTGATIAGFPKNVGAAINYSTPAVGYGRVFIGADDGKLHAFNAATGAAVAGFPKLLGCPVRSTPSLALGNVYVGCYGANLFAFNATTGVPVAGFPVNVDNASFGSPTVVGGKVYIGSNFNNLYAFDASTGAAVSGFPIATGNPIYSTVAASGATGFFGSVDTNLRGFRLANGIATPGFPVAFLSAIYGSPAIASGKVFVGAENGWFSAYSTSGVLAWNRVLESAAYGSPMVANGVVYTSTIYKLYALSATTGATLWSTDATSGLFNSPVVADGILYYASSDGKLYAFSVHGEPLSARRPGGALGVKPALSSLRPDLSLRAR